MPTLSWIDSRYHVARLLLLSLLILLTLILCFSLYSDSIFWSDSAVNELLTLKAKQFTLTHGNYSRVGIFHPGGLWFYILALFDTLFSPFHAGIIGQMFITVLLHVTAIFLLGHAIGRHIFNLKTAPLALITSILVGFLLVTLIFNDDQTIYLLNGWMPSMYISFMSLWLAGLIYFPYQIRFGAIWIALGGSLLLNGHISFILITGATTSLFLFLNRKKIIEDSISIDFSFW